jgi:hypothetical protein
LLAFFAKLLAHMGLTWVVWGLMSCSMLMTPSMISFHSHLTLVILLLLGLLVGSLAGIGEMNNNDGYFCENIRNGFLYVMTQHLLILKGIYGFKFPKRFLEISSRDLTLLSILII